MKQTATESFEKMFVVPHRVGSNKDRKRGVIATAPIKAGMPVWYAGPDDIVLTLDDIRRLTDIQLEALMGMGWVRLAYARNKWVIGGDLVSVRWEILDHGKRPANLRAEFDILVADRRIKKGEELVFPKALNADEPWMNRMHKPGSWRREGDRRAAKADVKTYLAYIRRQGVGCQS